MHLRFRATAAAILIMLTFGSVVSADEPRPVTTEDIDGNWIGKQDNVTADLFWEDGSLHLRQRSTHATVVAEVDPVNDKDQGTLGLHLRYKAAEDGFSEVHSVVIGRVERDRVGSLVLTLYPAAKKFEFVTMSKVTIRKAESKTSG